jgi:RNA polymerase sigma-70 factor (ECF subfamily)
VKLPAKRFMTYLASRVEVTEDPRTSLNAMHADDLYLVAACLDRDSQALKLLDLHFLGKASRAASTKEPRGAELQQELRTHLLVGPPGGEPALTSYRGTGPLGAWLRLIAVRLARAAVKASRKSKASSDEVLDGLVDNKNPEVLYLKRRYTSEVAEAVTQALGALPIRDRNLLNQYYADRMTSDEIAVLYRLNGSTVRRNLARLRKQLLVETHRRLTEKLQLSPHEAESLIAFVRSELEITLSGRNPEE